MATTAEYGLGELAYPRGWFMVAVAADVTSVPQSVHFFGKERALYRGKSGRVVMLDAFCPHMKANIARNTQSYIVKDGIHVEGDSIRCPAHGWRFTPEGQCDDIPYSAHSIPKAACIKSHKVVEKAGCIWVWNDMEGGEPDFDLPAFAEWDQTADGWVRWNMVDLGTLPIHPQEIVDNFADFAHFMPVHGSTNPTYFENTYDGASMYQRFGAGHRTLAGEAGMLESEAYYTGPGILISNSEGRYPGRLMICHTPVKDGEVRAWVGQMSKMADGREATAEEVQQAAEHQKDTITAFAQDFELWQYKEAAINILQIRDDGPFHLGRIWYKQFFNPRARAGEFQKRVDGTVSTLDVRDKAVA